MRRPVRRIVIGVVLAVLLVCGGLGIIGKWLFAPPQEVTDLNSYPSVLADWADSGLVGHFPPAIPSQSNGARFSSLTKFMQGFSHVQLRMPLSAGEITRLETSLRTTAKHIYVGGGNRFGRDMPTTTFHTADDPPGAHQERAFPPHYTFYLLSAIDRSPPTWNHGSSFGVVLSLEVNEAIYWAESW